MLEFFTNSGAPVQPPNVKGIPPNTTYVTPGLQPGAWQHPTVAPPTQPAYQPAPGPYQQPQRVVVVVNAPNFGKRMYLHFSDEHESVLSLILPIHIF